MNRPTEPSGLKRAALAAAICAAALCLCACRQRQGAAKAEVDIDLSGVSPTIAYAQVCDIYAEPWDYVDKVISIRGTPDFYIDAKGEERGLVMVQDATACCGQGVEYVCGSSYGVVYPEDEGEEVIVTGRLEQYQEEDGRTYIHLADASIEWEDR